MTFLSTRRQLLELLGKAALATGMGSIKVSSKNAGVISPQSPSKVPRPQFDSSQCTQLEGQGNGNGASYDLIVLGGTPSGIVAAVAAVRQGLKVALVEPTAHLGGILTNGLGQLEYLYLQYLGGLPLKFCQDVVAIYGTNAMPSTSARPFCYFEPHVAERIFKGYLSSSGVAIYLNRHISTLAMDSTGLLIGSITLDNGTTLNAKMWIDASYEGDLMAASGASYAVGRESVSSYDESLAGWGTNQTIWPVVPVLPNQQLLPGENTDPNEAVGDGDQKIMAYTFRTCLTTRPSNRAPFPKPPGYSPQRYQGLAASIQQNGWTQLGQIADIQYEINQKYNLLRADLEPFSTNYVGGGWNYPNATWVDRKAVIQDHYNYVAGWLYFVANDPSVPSSIQTQLNRYGLPLDEFVDNANWPWQMYIREGRRLLGQYVLTQADITSQLTKTDSIAVGQWMIDIHWCDCFEAGATMPGAPSPGVGFDGEVFEPIPPFEIPYRAILPNPAQVSNLAVTCCLSASHIAFGAARVESAFMALGEAAGTAAGLAVQAGVGFSQVNVVTLQTTLTANGAKISL